ncbi:hypothetical protein VTN02DRAFT_3377 [Thermoascus thermophilus]
MLSRPLRASRGPRQHGAPSVTSLAHKTGQWLVNRLCLAVHLSIRAPGGSSEYESQSFHPQGPCVADLRAPRRSTLWAWQSEAALSSRMQDDRPASGSADTHSDPDCVAKGDPRQVASTRDASCRPERDRGCSVPGPGRRRPIRTPGIPRLGIGADRVLPVVRACHQHEASHLYRHIAGRLLLLYGYQCNR